MKVFFASTNEAHPDAVSTNSATILLEGDEDGSLLDTTVMTLTNFIGWLDDPLMSPTQKLDAMRAELDQKDLREDMKKLIATLHFAAWNVYNDDPDWKMSTTDDSVLA